MTKPKPPKPPKQTYQILVNRYALFEFAVEANSREEACKILQRELRSGELKKAKRGSQPVEPFWADPGDKGDAWAVVCATPTPGASHAPVMAWNGSQILDSVFPPISLDGTRTARRTVKR